MKTYYLLFLVLVACEQRTVATTQLDSTPPIIISSAARADVVLTELSTVSDTADTALNGSDLVTRDSGRLMLTLLVACALPADDEFDVSGVQFFGENGLAPRWTSGAISVGRRKLVTACVLAKLSADGLPAVVSTRGSVEEGAFFGDIFRDKSVIAACHGENSDVPALAHRLCARPDPGRPGLTLCGLRLAGECRDVCDHGRCRVDDRRYRAITTFAADP